VSARASLKTLFDEVDFIPQETTVYLNRKTGEIVSVTDDEMIAAEDNEDLVDYSEWEHDVIRKAQEISESDDYIALPSQFDLDEYSIMRDFCGSVEDDEIREEFFRAIAGRGAFRWFKDRIHHYGLQKRWYTFREEAIKQELADWCEANGITCDP
jgi:hypothetical protein